MSRYFVRAGKPLYVETPLWHDTDSLCPDLSVPDHHPIDTGLVNHRGDRIMKAPEVIGFHNPKGA